jgi:ribosomal protein S18 acetylase RimI-like enzyme
MSHLPHLIAKLENHAEWVKRLVLVGQKSWHTPLQKGGWSPAEVIHHFHRWDDFARNHRFIPFLAGRATFTAGAHAKFNEQSEREVRDGLGKEAIIVQCLKSRYALIETVEKLREEAWEQTLTIGDHDLSIHTYLQGVIEHDRHHREQIEQFFSLEQQGKLPMVNITERCGEELPMNLLLLADPEQAMIERYLSGGLGFLAEVEGTPVGVIVLKDKGHGLFEVMNIAVAEQEQGKGYGKLLLLHGIHVALKRGADRIEIGTGNSSIGQLALYQRCGFSITAVDKDFFTKHYHEPIVEQGIRCEHMIRLAQDLK